MAYYTYSQGFRPGGFNRTASSRRQHDYSQGRGALLLGDKNERSVLEARGLLSDNLLNNEIGIKSEFFEHRLQVNVSLYKMNWSNVQLPLFDPLASRQHHVRRQRPDLRGQGRRTAVGRQASPKG
jgi:iron complex outermembrane receptor protein